MGDNFGDCLAIAPQVLASSRSLIAIALFWNPTLRSLASGHFDLPAEVLDGLMSA